MSSTITVGVLALQGAFIEHIKLLNAASTYVELQKDISWSFIEVRTPQQLERCDALIIPGGESTTVSLVAARSGLLEPLRDFVKYVPSSADAFVSLQALSDLSRCTGSTASQHGVPAPD